MKRALILSGILVILLCSAASPAQAFTVKNLDIAVQENTDAVITFSYELAWFENFAVFLRIADPGVELKNALEGNFRKPVQVTVADGGRSQFLVQDFAMRQERNGTVIMRTPSLSFTEAERVLNQYRFGLLYHMIIEFSCDTCVLNQYWFAQLVSPDFSPEVTRVSFPDGYYEEFDNQISIPAVQHTLS